MGTRALGMLNLWSATVTIAGALAWGLVGLFRYSPFGVGAAPPRGFERLLYVAIGFAGAWLAMPRIVAVLAARPGLTSQRRLGPPIIGKTLPTISGSTLTGRQVILPSDTLGNVTFLVLVFGYSARRQAEDWSDAIEQRFQYDPGATFFEIAMVPMLYRLTAAAVGEGIRRAVPEERHDRVITVYGPVGSFRDVLGAAPNSDVWIYLLDRDGMVAFQYGGSYNRRRFGRLVSAAEKVLSEEIAAPVKMPARRFKAA